MVHMMELEHPRTVFFDIGAVVYFLRLVPWIVPDFTVREVPRRASQTPWCDPTRDGGFATTASRMLVDVRKP